MLRLSANSLAFLPIDLASRFRRYLFQPGILVAIILFNVAPVSAEPPVFYSASKNFIDPGERCKMPSGKRNAVVPVPLEALDNQSRLHSQIFTLIADTGTFSVSAGPPHCRHFRNECMEYTELLYSLLAPPKVTNESERIFGVVTENFVPQGLKASPLERIASTAFPCDKIVTRPWNDIYGDQFGMSDEHRDDARVHDCKTHYKSEKFEFTISGEFRLDMLREQEIRGKVYRQAVAKTQNTGIIFSTMDNESKDSRFEANVGHSQFESIVSLLYDPVLASKAGSHKLDVIVLHSNSGNVYFLLFQRYTHRGILKLDTTTDELQALKIHPYSDYWCH